MHRFFVPGPPDSNGGVSLTGKDAKHATRVLRLREGDTFLAVVPPDRQYIARIVESGTYIVRAVIEAPVERVTEAPIEVWLYQGLPKGDKMDLVVSRVTELGIAGVVPVITDRTVVRPEPERAHSRVDRWRKIAREAAELCGRTHVPKVMEPLDYSSVLEASTGFELKLMPWEQEQSRGIKTVLRQSQASRVFLLIGPEGGFTEREASEALRKGILPVTLGPRMMRTENAGAIALAMIMYELGDMC